MSVINRNSGSPIFNTLAEAQASNMNIGQLPIVLGSASAFDGGGIIYSVQPNGSGGIAMTNGNELVQYTGTAAVLDAQTSPTDTTAGRVLTTDAEDIAAGTLYHTGNLNQFEFDNGGGSSGEGVLALGYALNANNCRFMLPISLFDAPSSITEEGTFEIRNSANATLVSGVTGFALNSASSNKVALLGQTSSGAFTSGEILFLRTETNSSKITVNP